MFQLLPLFQGGLPSEDLHGDGVGLPEVSAHLYFQNFIAVEAAHVIVETFLVVSVAALYLPVMLGRPGTDPLVLDVQPGTEDIQYVDPVGFLEIGKLKTVVRLKNLRLVTKVVYSPVKEVHGGVAALLHIRVDKALTGSFLDNGVLIKLLSVFAAVTGSRDKFNIHLPFNAKEGRSIIFLGLVFLLFGFRLVGIPHPALDPV